MNVFRVASDVLHVVAILILSSRLLASKNAQGEVYAIGSFVPTTWVLTAIVQNRYRRISQDDRAITEPERPEPRFNIIIYISVVVQLALTFGGLVWPLSPKKLVPLCAQWTELCCLRSSGTVAASSSHFQHYEYDPYHTKWTMCAGIVSFVAVLWIWAMLATSQDPFMSSSIGPLLLLLIGYGLCFAIVFLIVRLVLLELPRRMRRVDVSMMVDGNDLLLDEADIVLQAVKDKSEEDLLREPLLVV